MNRPRAVIRWTSYEFIDQLRLIYILRDSGVFGSLTSGRIERDGEGLTVYNKSGDVNEYASGSKLKELERFPRWSLSLTGVISYPRMLSGSWPRGSY